MATYSIDEVIGSKKTYSIDEVIGKSQKQAKQPKSIDSTLSRFATGVRDPIVGTAQLVNNFLDSEAPFLGQARTFIDDKLHQLTGGVLGYEGGDINKAIAEREQQYQAPEGIDFARMGGNIATSLLATRGMGTPTSAMNAAKQAAVVGGGLAAANPIVSDDFGQDKLNESMFGAAVSAPFGPLGYVMGRMASPKGLNAAVKELEAQGVIPTTGQRLGGLYNDIEQKLTSVPFLGKGIADARYRAQEQFNKATINEALAPINKTVDKIGTKGVKEADQLISNAYNEAKSLIPGINLDDIAEESLKTLRRDAKFMKKSERRVFDKFYKEEVEHFLSPARGMTSETYKSVDSSLGKIIRKTPENMSLFGALKELQAILREQAKRVSPEYAQKIKAADTAFAMMERVREAAKSAKLNDGTFTPGKLMGAVSKTDSSLRKKAVAEGDALLQPQAMRAQNIIGNTVPDSGTQGRLAASGMLGGTAFYDPIQTAIIGASLMGAKQLYNPTGQRLLNKILSERPETMRLLQSPINKISPLLPSSYFGSQ